MATATAVVQAVAGTVQAVAGTVQAVSQAYEAFGDNVEEIHDQTLVHRAPERVIKRKAPDITNYQTLKDPLNKILELLTRDDVKGICIYGTVGVGKTTIMLNLNNHNEVAENFEIVIWLPVSKEGGEGNLTREHLQHIIAQRLKLPMEGTSNADEVARSIDTKLKGKKYLLLLDDVKENLDLNAIGIPFDNTGSKIVLTTRLRHICCKQRFVNEAIKVSYLSPDEAWEMFQDVLRNKELLKDPTIGPLAFQVCRECGGLPRLIETVANTFKLKDTEELWSEGLNSWRMWPSQECKGIREIYELLRFCYNDLVDDRYRKCFLYGALYPEDSDINKDSLLECWGGDNLLGDGNDARKMRFMIGNTILSRLTNVSLLEKGKSDYHVTMHKFIRQVALYISEDHPECKHLVETNKELREPPHEESWKEKNRISLGDNELDRLPTSPECSKLSTLFLQKNLGLEKIPPAFFKHMIKLRVLDLSQTGIVSLDSLPSLFLSSLKVLNLNNCKQLVELSNIEKLKDLEFLDIHGSGINGIPSDITKLKLLKHLWVSFGNGNDAQGGSFNHDMILELSELEELVIDFESLEQWTEVAEKIMEKVAKLEKFKKLRVCYPEMIVDAIQFAPKTLRIRIPEARILQSYIRSRWTTVRSIGPFRFFIGCQNSEYHQNPNFNRYKKYVKYCNGAGDNTPLLEVLAEAQGFELVGHKDIKQLSDFGTANLNKIQGFLIDSCDAMETIVGTVGSELLPNIEQLFMKNLSMLKSIWKKGPLQTGCQASKLTTLVISKCPLLDNVFPPGVIQRLCEIKYLTIEKCELKEIFPREDASQLVLPNLKGLILLQMAKLSSICVMPLRLSSLVKLKIFQCPGVHILPFDKGNVKKLECIEAEKAWWGALQWRAWPEQEDKEELQKLCSFRSLNDDDAAL